MSVFAYIILFTFISGVLSLAGGIILLGRTKWVHKFSIHFISFAAGALLATAFLDLLPEASKITANPETTYSAALAGMIIFLFFEQLIIKCHARYRSNDNKPCRATPILLMFGDAFHNFVDGVMIAAAFLVNIPLGIVTALAVAAHEIPQEIGDFSIMISHGWPRRKVLWTNVFVSLTSVAGAVLAFAAKNFIEPFLPYLLALTAGIFIYIAGTDLLPEISSGQKADKASHVAILLLLGVALVWTLNFWLGV